MKKNGVSSNNDDNNQDKPIGMRNVIALGADFSTEMILGILPLFIVNNLGAPKAVLGSLSDRLGKRKIFVLAGYGLSTISKPFFCSNNRMA